MKILILNPPYMKGFCRSARWAAKSRGRVQRHPDWLLVAAAVLEKDGHDVKFIDGAALELERQDVIDNAKEFMPELIVIHTTTPSIYNDIEYAKILKQQCQSTTVLIGHHVSALPENTFMLSAGSVDFIARGEYDYTLRDIARKASKDEIEGISYMDNGAVHHNPDRAALDVNELPPPAWHHVKPEWYKDAGKRFPFLTLLSGRGCYGRCTFCRDTSVMYGRKLRLRAPESVVDEIEYDYKLFPYLKEIMFETDTFAASSGHVAVVCEEILKRGLKITWSCNVRVDMDLKLLPLMKKAGCRMLMIGFEFGSQEALDSVKKGAVLDQSRALTEAAHKLGFTQHGCFMFGAPGENKEMARKTIDFAKSLPLDTVQFSGICVYPGTPLYDWAKKNNFITASDWKEWVDENGEQVTLLDYPDFKKEDMDAMIDTGLREFYLRPEQIFRMIFRTMNFNDFKRKAYGLFSFMDSFKASNRPGSVQKV